MNVRNVAKAIVGGALAGLTALGTALADGSGVSQYEWVGVAVAALGVAYGVWQTSDGRSAKD